MTCMNLPDDLLHKIFSYLTDEEDLINVSRISSRWKEIAISIIRWKNRIRHETFHLKNSFKWKYIEVDSRKPSDRYGSSMVHTEDYLYVFGGATKDHTFFNDLWRFHLKEYHWERLFGTGEIPNVCSFACSGSNEDFLFFYGGCYEVNMNRKWINYISCYEIKKKHWTKQNIVRHQPQSELLNQLVGQSNCNLQDSNGSKSVLFLFGGIIDKELHCTNRSYFITLDNGISSEVKLMTNKKPQGRKWTSLTGVRDDTIILIGGFYFNSSQNIFISDAWILRRSVKKEKIHESIWSWSEIDISKSMNPICKTFNFFNSAALVSSDGFSKYSFLDHTQKPANQTPSPNLDTILIVSIAEETPRKNFGVLRSQKIDSFLQLLKKCAKTNKELRDLAEKFSDSLADLTPLLVNPDETSTVHRMTIHSITIDTETNVGSWNKPENIFIDDPIAAPSARIFFNAALTLNGIFIFGGVPLIDPNSNLKLLSVNCFLEGYLPKAIDTIEKSINSRYDLDLAYDIKNLLSNLFSINSASLLRLTPRQFT